MTTVMGMQKSIIEMDGRRKVCVPFIGAVEVALQLETSQSIIGFQEGHMLEAQIIDKPALTVIGLESSFIHALSPDATNFQVIGPLWGKFTQRANQVPNRIGDKMYGINYGRPDTERKHPHELQYIAAVAASSTAEIPDGMVSRTIPAGKFAVFTHRGPIKNIGDTCYQIYRVWLPQSAWQHAQIADVELYDKRFCVKGADSEMEYWISVVPKTSP